MLKENTFSLLFIFAFSSIGFAQQELAGKMVKKGSTEILAGVTVINRSLGKNNISDMGGNYKIPARAGDTILFSSAGYRPDTLIVRPYMLSESWLVDLSPNIVTLASVNVEEESNYQFDSVKRRDEYRYLLDRKHPIKLMNEKRANDAPGFNFSPFGYKTPHFSILTYLFFYHTTSDSLFISLFYLYIIFSLSSPSDFFSLLPSSPAFFLLQFLSLFVHRQRSSLPRPSPSQVVGQVFFYACFYTHNSAHHHSRTGTHTPVPWAKPTEISKLN